MKECDNSTRKIHINSNFILSISLLIMFDTLLLRPSLHCNTPLHFTTLHPTTVHYTSQHFTTLHPNTLHYTNCRSYEWAELFLHILNSGRSTVLQKRSWFRNNQLRTAEHTWFMYNILKFVVMKAETSGGRVSNCLLFCDVKCRWRLWWDGL